MRGVAIIGAGITGLTAAFYLKRKGVSVTVYESSPRPGGVIRSVWQNGYLAECGPNTILETSPKIARFIEDAGLAARRLYSAPAARAKYLVRDGRPIAMPGSALGFFTTRLFSSSAKLALLREPFVRPRRDGQEESIAQFVQRRLGQEFLEQAIDALVGGIYAGDPYKLSVSHAFPKLCQLESRYGSLIRGQLLGARERKKSGEVAKDRAPAFSFDDGLQVLTDSLRDHLGGNIHLETMVGKLTQTSTGWILDLSAQNYPTQAEHSAVLYAGTAFQLAELPVQARQALDFGPLSAIRYPPVASVVLGFRREDVAHPCTGFGMLIPRRETFKLLGTVFSSSLFPGRAPAGHVTLSSYVGGERDPELASLPVAQLIAVACEDLKVLLGVSGKPAFEHTAFYPKAIPQYNIGFGRFRELMSQAEEKAPGLFLAGNYRDGVSLSDSILSGCKAAERIEGYLSRTVQAADKS